MVRARDRVSFWLGLTLFICAATFATFGYLAVAGLADKADEARTAAEVTRDLSDRTECFRAASAALDAARWDLVAELFTVATPEQAKAIGAQLAGLPKVTDISERGATVGNQDLRACPPPPAP